MDAIELLKDDHDKAKKMLEELDATTERAVKAREELFTRLKAELVVHEAIEEEIFYPALREHPKAKDMVLEGLVEHHVVGGHGISGGELGATAAGYQQRIVRVAKLLPSALFGSLLTAVRRYSLQQKRYPAPIILATENHCLISARDQMSRGGLSPSGIGETYSVSARRCSNSSLAFRTNSGLCRNSAAERAITLAA